MLLGMKETHVKAMLPADVSAVVPFEPLFISGGLTHPNRSTIPLR
jgi:hypothetical protein